MTVRWPILVGGALFTAVLVAILGSGFGGPPVQELPDKLSGDKAPGFALVDLDGKTWSLEELRGTPLLINFWSTWCLPCKQEHPMLLGLAEQYPDVQFLGVIYQDEPRKVSIQMSRFPYGELMQSLARAGVAYPNLVDPNGRAAIEYGIGGVPESFFVDRSGMVVHKQIGPLSAPVAREHLERIRRP